MDAGNRRALTVRRVHSPFARTRPIPPRAAAAAALRAACIVLFACLTPVSNASVFARLRGKGDAESVMQSTGARRIMRRDATVNGIRGEQTIWLVPPECAADAAAIDRLNPGTLSTWVPGADGSATVFLFCPEAGASGSGSAEWPFPDIPMPGGFQPVFSSTAPTAADFSICGGTAAATPSSAASALEGALRGSGYAALPPGLPGSGLSIWENDGMVALAWAGAAPDGSTSWILLSRRHSRSGQ